MPPKAAATIAAGAAKPNGKGPKGDANGKPASAKPAAAVSSEDVTSDAVVGGLSKPDKVAFDREQESLKNEIESLNKKLVRFLLPIFS